MKRDDVIDLFLRSQLSQRWHWYAWQFTSYLSGREHPFAGSIVDACLEVENKLPGFAAEFATRLGSISGRAHDRRDYQQLLQQLAELLVIRQVVTFAWRDEAQFEYEPRGPGSKKNPELVVCCGDARFGIEVKAPALLDHQEKRAANPVQLPSRAVSRDMAESLIGGAAATLPRDNPVKDFLLSAEAKFAPFRLLPETFYGILVIVWDDHIYEPISALQGSGAGLFTQNTFARLPDGGPNTFAHVDAVIVLRHLHTFHQAAAAHPVFDASHALDYGRDQEFPPKAYIQNPAGQVLPEIALRCFQAYPPGPELGAEYLPTDMVLWVNPRGASPEKPRARKQPRRRTR
jgi:hypothetical protein